MEFLNFIGTKLFNAWRDGVCALARARQARNDEEMNRELRRFAQFLILIRLLNASVEVGALMYQRDDGVSAYLTNIYAPFSPMNIGFFLTDFSALFAGWFLVFINNPGDYIKLATCAMFAATAGAVFAIGILIATSFATLRT